MEKQNSYSIHLRNFRRKEKHGKNSMHEVVAHKQRGEKEKIETAGKGGRKTKKRRKTLDIQGRERG